MTPDEMAQLTATFGTPAALLIYMWMQSQKPKADLGESLGDKLDAIKDSVHAIETRLTKVETILEEREPPKVRR
jgi:predicted transcriptional regulator